MNIVYVAADSKEEWNCSEWRCAVPARAINRTAGHSASLVSLKDFALGAPAAEGPCASADVIVVQRNLFGPVLAAIQHWKARDKVVVADFDDAYDLMPPSVANHRFWIQGVTLHPGPDGRPVPGTMDPPPLTQFKWGLRLVHAATVPSKRLADDWQNYTDVHYLPNYIDLEKYQNIPPRPHAGVHIGWGGSISHLQSFTGSGVLAALKRVCRARPEVRVIINGDDRRVFDRLPLPPEQKVLRPFVPYARWPHQLADFDIGLAPLSGAYDDRRSWIKPLEYMVMKIPWVASDGPAYHELRPYGWLVKNTPSAWERVLLDMVDHLDDYRDEAGREPYLFGIGQAVDVNVESLLATYAAIVAQAQPAPSGVEIAHARFG